MPWQAVGMEIDWARGNTVLVDGMEVAHADREWFRERATVQIGPELWDYRSAGWARGTLVADLDGTTRFTARRSGLLVSRWTIDVGDQLELSPAGIFTTRLRLARGGTPIGEASRSGLFTTRPRLTLTESLDISAACFVLWVAFVELNRRASSDGAASAG